MRTWKKIGAPALVVVGVSAVVSVLAVVACSKDGPYVPVTGGHATAAAQCSPDAGQLPDPTCDGTTNATGCDGITPGCNTAPCGDKTTCLPMSDNTGSTTQDLRIRRLTVFAPAALASPFVEKAIVDRGINLPICGEGGDGSFNWLIRIDTNAKTMTTGGAPPSDDPEAKGFCFANTTTGEGVKVTSVTAAYTVAADGSYGAGPITKLNVPIWLHGDRTNLILLPLSQVVIQGVSVSKDGNCIGKYNDNAVTSDCIDSRNDCARWSPHGALGGYITLEEADNIPLADLGGKTLCLLLTNGTPGGSDLKHCQRDASNKIIPRGDYCSSPAGPGGCGDSYWLTATLAAAAVKINDGSTDDLCKGGVIPTMDAGSDGAADDGAADGGTDAATD